MTAGQEGAGGFGAQALAHLERVGTHNAALLDAVAERMLTVVRTGGVLHTAGTGHSIAMVLETFYRAGGLACRRAAAPAETLESRLPPRRRQALRGRRLLPPTPC